MKPIVRCNMVPFAPWDKRETEENAAAQFSQVE